MLRGSGAFRLLALPITIVVGCLAAVPLGIYEIQPALDAPWLGLPEFSSWPGLGPVLGQDFVALLLAFLIVSVVVGIRVINEGAVIQGASWRRPRAPDYRSVQGTLNVSGVGSCWRGSPGRFPRSCISPRRSR